MTSFSSSRHQFQNFLRRRDLTPEFNQNGVKFSVDLLTFSQFQGQRKQSHFASFKQLKAQVHAKLSGPGRRYVCKRKSFHSMSEPQNYVLLEITYYKIQYFVII